MSSSIGKIILKSAGEVATGVINSAMQPAIGMLGARIIGGKAGAESYKNLYTHQGLTGEQEQLQKIQDSKYQRTVSDMIQAGINPAAAGLNGGDGAVAGSGQATVPQESLLTGLNKIKQNKLIKAQEKAQAIQNVYGLEKEYQSLQALIKDNEQKGINVEESKARLSILAATIDEQIEAYGLTNAKTRAEGRKAAAEAEQVEIANRFFEQIKQLEVMESEKRITEMDSHISLLKAQTKETEAKEALALYEKIYKASDIAIKQKLAEAQIMLEQQQAILASEQSAKARIEYDKAVETFDYEVQIAAEHLTQEQITSVNLPKDLKNKRNMNTVGTIGSVVGKTIGTAAAVAFGIKGGKKMNSAGSVTYHKDANGNIKGFSETSPLSPSGLIMN